MTDTVKTLIQFTNAQGITQAELARRLDVTPVAVWRWFNGDRNPNIKYVEKWALAIGYRYLIVWNGGEAIE